MTTQPTPTTTLSQEEVENVTSTILARMTELSSLIRTMNEYAGVKSVPEMQKLRRGIHTQYELVCKMCVLMNEVVWANPDLVQSIGMLSYAYCVSVLEYKAVRAAHPVDHLRSYLV